MITKEDLIAAMQRECDICVHLFSKFDVAGYDYRPSPDQRSTRELLQYLSHMPETAMTCMRDSDWSQFGKRVESASALQPADFPVAMERQKAAIAEFFSTVTDEQLRKQPAMLPGGRGESTLGHAIFAGPVQWLPAYKLQLFLYAKAAGAKGIGTSNAWGGRDMPPKA